MKGNQQKIGPWQRISSQEQYDNPWITVYHEEVITPGDTEGIYGRVHFKNKAVAVVVLDEEGFTYLVKQYRYTLEDYAIELPMGGCPHGENSMDAAKRELREETGLTANDWQPIQKLHTSNSVTDEEGYVYLATDIKQGDMQLEPSEDISVLRIAFSQAVEWAMTGKITDAISVAAILHVHCQQLAKPTGS